MKQNNKYVLGLIGGSGTGKTYIGNYLKDQMDAEFIEADKIGHEVINDAHIIEQIVNSFGDDVLVSGKIDRSKLGKIVFSNEEKRKLLNSIMHQAMYKSIESKILNCKQSVVVLEAAVMIEAGFYKLTDRMLYLTAEDAVKKDRLIKQRNIPEDKAIQLVALTRVEDQQYADDIVNTTHGIESIKNELDRIITTIKEAYSEKSI